MPIAKKEAVTLEPWAVRIGLGTLVLVTAVAVFTAWDRMHTAAVEEVITPTAVGDMHFVPEPANGVAQIGLTYQGRKLDMAAESKIMDSNLLRVGIDDSGVYTLYRLETEKEEGLNQPLYMKVGVNEFIQVKQE